MSHGMETIGNNARVYNLPFCIEGLNYKGLNYKHVVYEIVSSENLLAPEERIKNIIKQGIREGYTDINVAKDYSGHASLAHMSIDKRNNKFNLMFFDSYFWSDEQIKTRYDDIKQIIEKILPIPMKNYRVYHLLHQGGIRSKGCGYYTVYTALLLKNKTAEKLINQFKDQ